MNSTSSNLVSTRRLVFAGLFIALGMVLKLFSVYITESIQINFTTLPIMFSGIMLGPVYGGIVGFLSDFLDFIIKNDGSVFHIGFTLTNTLYGVIPGLIAMFVKKRNKEYGLKHILVTVVLCEIICSMCLNTIFLIQLYGYATVAMIPQRIIKSCLMIILDTFVLHVLYKNIKNRIKV